MWIIGIQEHRTMQDGIIWIKGYWNIGIFKIKEYG